MGWLGRFVGRSWAPRIAALSCVLLIGAGVRADDGARAGLDRQVSGRLVYADDVPAEIRDEGLDGYVCQAFGLGRAEDLPVWSVSVTTDKDGCFVIPDVPLDVSIVSIAIEIFDSESLCDLSDVLVSIGEAPATYVLRRAGSIAGRIDARELPDTRLLAAARVQAHWMPRDLQDTGFASAGIEEDLTFSCWGIPMGQAVELRVSTESGHRSLVSEPVTAREGERAVVLPVLLGETLQGCLLSRATGQALPAHVVTAYYSGGAACGLNMLGPTISDAEGRFAFFGLPPATFILLVHSPGGEMLAHRTDVRPEPAPVVLQCGFDDPADLPVEVRGVPGEQFRIQPYVADMFATPPVTGQLGPDGHWEGTLRVPSRTMSCSLRAWGEGRREACCRLETDESPRKPVVLQDSRTVRGRVICEHPDRVVVEAVVGGVSVRATTGITASGEFVIPGVPAGELEVLVYVFRLGGRVRPSSVAGMYRLAGRTAASAGADRVVVEVQAD